MTALRPHESWDVHPIDDHDIERKHLRKLLLNTTCAHPDCDKPTESMHHAWPVGTLKSSSWLVRVPGADKPILHAVGLCGSGTTGHHGDLEEHRGWLKFEDGVFNWYEKFPGEWRFVGPLSPQPGQITAPKKPRKKTEGTDRRKSKFIRFRVPDDAENGAEIISELVQVGREQWAGELGWGADVPDYFVFCAAFAKAFQT